MTATQGPQPIDAAFYDRSDDSEQAVRDVLPDGVGATRFVDLLNISVPVAGRSRFGGRGELRPGEWLVRFSDDSLRRVSLAAFNRLWRRRLSAMWQSDHRDVGRTYP